MSKSAAYTPPFATIDVVIFTMKDHQLFVVTQKRQKEPMLGLPALVGGFVHTEEDLTLDDTVSRVLRDKAGLTGVYFEQMQTFGSVNRDRRGWSVCVAYIAMVNIDTLMASPYWETFTIQEVNEVSGIAFDHGDIIEAACQRIKSKGSYSILPAFLLPEKFLMADLQKTYELVLGAKIDQSSFRRKMSDLNVIEETGETGGKFRPAALYRVKEGANLLFNRLI